MKPMTLTDAGAALNLIPHKAFDLSIENITERQKQAKLFESSLAVSAYLGVTPDTIFKNRKPGTRIYSPFLKKYFAVRAVVKNENSFRG